MKRWLYLILASIFVVAFHHFCGSKPEKEVSYKEAFATAYSVYTFEGRKVAKEKIVKCAQELYNKDKAKGKTDKEFKGFTRLGYCMDVINSSKYKDQISNVDHLAVLLPMLLAVLIIIALIIAIHFGLSAMRPLDFDNSATMFNNK